MGGLISTGLLSLCPMALPKTVACLLVALLVSFAALPAFAQEVEITEQAKLHFAVGVGLLEDPGGPRYAEAYESFQRAYKASPSPKILSNLGLCAMHIERDGEAIEAYELYLENVENMDAAERARIETDLKRLHAGMATLELNVHPIGALIIDERTPDAGPPIINRYRFSTATILLRVRSGNHNIRIEAKDHTPESFPAKVAPGDIHVQKVKLVEVPGKKKKKKKKRNEEAQPAPDPNPQPAPLPRRSKGGGISGASIGMIVVTGALTVGAVVMGVLALDAQSTYIGYQDGGDRTEAESVRATGEALNITTDVLIATAAASAIVTVVLLATTESGGESATLKVSPTVGGGTLGLDVRF